MLFHDEICKLIVCDLDGTLLDANQQMDPAFLQIMKQKNIPFTFATGRNYPIVKEFIEACQIHLPYITNNGANIFMGDTCIYALSIVEEELEFVINRLQSEQISFLLYSQDGIISYGTTKDLENFKKRLMSKCIIRDFHSMKQIYKQAFFKVVMVGENLDGICQSINDVCKNTIACQSEDNIYTITHHLATKGNALLYILQLMNIQPSEVYVFGDNHNDTSMFSVIENSVAMAHSEDYIQKQAKYVTDCVSSFIEKFL